MDVTETGSGGWKRHAVSFLVVAVSAWLLYRYVDVGRVVSVLADADPVLYMGAFLLFYIPFLFRGERWRLLLSAADIETSSRNASESVFLSFFANNIVPAQLGDVYRAHLLGVREDVSRSRVMGTVLVDRILDLGVLVIAVLVLGIVVVGAAFTQFMPYVYYGLAVVAVAFAVIVFLMLERGMSFLPIWIREKVIEGREGIRRSINDRNVFPVALYTVLVWVFVAFRVFLVGESLSAGLSLGVAAFLAFFMILVTILPLTPAGLGVVEVLSTGLLAIIGIDAATALSIVLLDRSITYVSLVVIGGIVYLTTDRKTL